MEPASTSTPLPQSSSSSSNGNDGVPILPQKQENSTSLTSAPAADMKQTHITIQAMSQDGNSLQFKVRMATPLQKVIDAYCARLSVAENSVRFLYDGNRVKGENTPEIMEMEDGDILDVVLHQSGGGGFVSV